MCGTRGLPWSVRRGVKLRPEGFIVGLSSLISSPMWSGVLSVTCLLLIFLRVALRATSGRDAIMGYRASRQPGHSASFVVLDTFPCALAPASSMNTSSTRRIRSWSWMTYQEHGHRGTWSISIAALERSSDIEVPDTVDEDPSPRDSEGASLHRGHFRT
jgi:hypothetical protein